MKRIAIVKDGHEGGFHINGTTGQVIQEGDLPEWGQGYVVAHLGERTGWYEQRLGQQLPDSIRSPEVIQVVDLEWSGLDPEGDEVHIEADNEYRMSKLAEILGLDLTDAESFESSPLLQKAIMSAQVDHTLSTHPTDEATLEEAEGKTFSEVQAANG